MTKAIIAFFCLGIGVGVGSFVAYRGKSLRETSDSFVPTSSGRLDTTSVASSAGRISSRAATAQDNVDKLEATLDAMLAHFDASEAEAWAARGGWTREMILAAFAHLAGKPGGASHKAELKSLLYRAWARLAPDEAWKAALADSDIAGVDAYAAAVAGEIAKSQPSTAIALALSLGPGGRRATVLREVLAEWGATDIAGVVAYWNSHPELPADEDAIEEVLRRAGKVNPSLAAAQALLLRGANIRGPVLAQVLIEWAKQDATAAVRWAQGIRDPSERASELAIVVDAWAGRQPEAALAFAETIEDFHARTLATRNAWSNWLQKDPEAAMAYLAANPSPAMLDVARDSFVSATSSLKPEEQRALLAKIQDDTVRQKISARLVDRQVSDGRYDSAITLLNSLPDSRERDYALGNLGQWWGRDDPHAVEGWLKGLPDSSDRDLAVEGFARTLATSDPARALEWIGTVTDRGVREGGMKNIALRWLESEPAAAEAWIRDQSWLSDTDKGYLRENASKNGSSHFTFGVNVTDRR